MVDLCSHLGKRNREFDHAFMGGRGKGVGKGRLGCRKVGAGELVRGFMVPGPWGSQALGHPGTAGSSMKAENGVECVAQASQEKGGRREGSSSPMGRVLGLVVV